MPETIELLSRKAQAGKSTVNVEDRSVEVCWSTGAAVKRYSWEDGYYLEELQVDKKSIRLDRFESMALLDTHDNYSMDSVLGTVIPGSVRIEGGKAFARVRFSKKQRADEVFRDVQDGHKISISVGYKIHRTEKTEGTDGKLPTLRAVDWEPMELSVVPIPADPGAFSRSEETSMPNSNHEQRQDEQQQRVAPAPAPAPAPNIINERTRVKSLRSLAKLANVDDAVLERAIDDGTTSEAFAARALELQVQRQEQSPTFPHSETYGMQDGNSREIQARTDALYARMSGTRPEGDARTFMSLTLLDHARGILEAQGVDTRGMSREQVLGFRNNRSYAKHTTSDFPQLLQGAGERTLMAAYQAAQSPLKAILARPSTATDFRSKSRLKVSDGGLLEKVNQAGEITSTSRAESSESYRVETYARIFGLSFQAIINDDLNAFGDWARWAGQMAAATEAKVMLDLLLANAGKGPTMSETGKALFHADHNNLATTGTALDETNLAAAILAFRKQTAPGGYRIGAAPKYLLIGPELELTAQKLLASITPAKTDDAIPEAIKSLVPVVEPNLDGKSWRVFADPAVLPVFEYAHLSGHDGVQLDTREGFEVLGTEFRAVLHYGAGGIDFRGGYMNAGT